MIVSELSTQVNDLLRPMGITRNLSAYSILCQCLELVCEQEDRLQAVEKDIYTPIADRRRCEPKAIQSAVRRAAKGAWLTNPEYVQQLAGYPLTGALSAVLGLERAEADELDLLVVLQGVDNGVEGSVDHNLGLLLGNAGFFRHGSHEFSLVHRLILLNSFRRRGLRGVYEQKALQLLVI